MQVESYSQLNQDINIINFFNKKENLFFIDIGAYDGIYLSNTFLLEKRYKWSGICCEPLITNFEILKKIRNVNCDNNAVFSKSNLKLNFSDATELDAGFHSGITEYISNSYKVVKKCKQEIVNTITLQDLLIKYDAPKIIHYMSLDTEGTELEILKSVNFNQYIFLYINVEHNYTEPKRTEIRKLLEQNNYIYKGENSFDDDYIHKNTIIGTYYYMNDYSKPIEITMDNDLKLNVKSPYWSDCQGMFDPKNLEFIWNGGLGTGKLYYAHIDYGNGNVWHRDKRKI